METQQIHDPVRNTPKFSRYKSVRRAAAAEQQLHAQGNALPGATKPKSDTIARSMSRYRRPRTAATGTAAVDSPALPAMPATHHIPPPINKTWHGAAGADMNNHETSSKGTENNIEDEEIEKDEEEEELSAAEKARLREETMRTLTMAEGPRPAAARAASDFQEKNKIKNDALKPESDHHQQHLRRASWKEKLGFSRHKTSADPDSKQGNIEPNGKGIVPGIDAPLSAVNAGERRVLIRYGSASFNLPVTPTTRAKDLIYSAVACVSERIDPRTAILVETFSSLGLERPLRRYEHIRDVLNSWATDDADSLVVCESPHEGAHGKLDLKGAPSVQPIDATFYLYHSSKPGKWDKRYVTLRSDGQVVVSKKANAKEAKDLNNICHISDFDIYTPSARQLSRNLKPPKKICFAVKSQQKSSMFLSTENFVHYFATNDSQIAQSWYDAVHDWRSWYLARVLKLDEKYQKSMNNQASMPLMDLQQSTDAAPVQLGSKPLLDFSRNTDLDAKGSDTEPANLPSSTRDIFLRNKKARENAPPPSAFPSNLPKLDLANSSASDQDDDATFLPDSLLGRTYSQKQAVQREREAREANDNDPFMSHGLLRQISAPTSNRSNSSAHHPMRSPHRSEGFSHSRSNSVRQKPKPLVDLTPVYQEPPQHARKGHGVRIEAGVPLVEGATGLESIPGVPEIPPATTWKREQARPSTANESSAASIAPRRGNTIRSTPKRDFSNSSDSAFMSNGLLAQTGYGTNTGVGRGVATGHRQATRPLLDMTPTSQFVEGSLLRKMERQP
ncbi:hypothetical protein PISL3812_04490 [Talaromyces islandicus]|uniref:PH domain-containing protein n=1 Tax=Talaromyces islandicus TaxID=28573 RepID=A0A0U1LWL6_TALIS|nr:hypothetical protein PISL3812_04490 [Talaromyces islandicus]